MYFLGLFYNREENSEVQSRDAESISNNPAYLAYQFRKTCQDYCLSADSEILFLYVRKKALS